MNPIMFPQLRDCLALQAADCRCAVILFKHGVGFFSRAGELKAGETARLDFQGGRHE